MQKRLKWIIVSIFIVAMSFGLSETNVIASEVTREITGFEEFDINENALHLLIEYKPSLEELTEMMPDELAVYLEGNSESEYIAVDWFCVAEDYEASDNFYFQFSPIWDEEKYRLSDDIELLTEAPYIAVFFKTEEEAVSTYAVTNNSNESKIFKYLTETMGYNVAAACGAMANIYCESSFIPTNLQNSYESKLGHTDLSYTAAVDSGSYTNFVKDTAGYGLCQWTYWSRKQGLLNFAKSSGTSIGDLTMQLNFLKKEISGSSTDNYMRAAENTAAGAYNVGYYYCEVYERPAQKEDEVSIYRGNLAKNTYWAEYGSPVNYTIRMSGQNVPGTMTTGNSFSVTGTISSDVKLTNVTVGVYDYAGVMRIGKSFNPNAVSYDLKDLASTMAFNKLEPGIYVYKVSAQNSNQTKYFIDHKFVVLANSQTISNGKYMLESRGTSALVVDVAGHSNGSGANLQLAYKANTEYQFFEITHVGGGYYTIKNCGSGKYMDVTNGVAANQTNVQQKDQSGGAAQKWQILRLGDSYCFVPQCATAYCLNIQNGGKTEGSNIQIYSANLNISQKFKLITGKIYEIFSDVQKGDWFLDYVEYVFKNDMMSGDRGQFIPNGLMTRAMAVETLYKLEGRPQVTDYSKFEELTDLKRQDWWAASVAWALNEGVATGDTYFMTFNPEAPVTREELATFLYRYAKFKQLDTSSEGDLTTMLNADQVSEYAQEALAWAVGEGLITGIELSDGAFDLAPQEGAIRAQMATIITRFCRAYNL